MTLRGVRSRRLWSAWGRRRAAAWPKVWPPTRGRFRRAGPANPLARRGHAMDESVLIALAGPVPVAKPSGRLAGKVCLVTGGASGIGRATALRMAQEVAAAVVIGGRRQALGEKAAEELRAAGTDGLFVPADVTRRPTPRG